ncbi:hypothetical protein BT69DRAFT_1250513 [Atractiella rhizophila]|nr:hypothetical protein BT69DRAFT_1250513 [Atractiella rhizophila]
MCFLSASIRSKPRWWEKYKHKNIREKWKREALEQVIPVNFMKGCLSPEAVDWVLKELKEYDRLRTEGGIEVSCFDGIWQSDSLVAPDTRSALISSLHPLENLPESEKDWQPRSDNQVLNLVDPSLYPIVYRRTRAYSRSMPVEERNWWNIQELILPWCPVGSLWTFPPWRKDYTVSESFSWLPTPFKVSEDGKMCKIASYINNLDPKKYLEVYKALEDIFLLFVPMFERVLSDLQMLPNVARQRVMVGDGEFFDEEDEDNHEELEEDEEDGGKAPSAPASPTQAPTRYDGVVPPLLSNAELAEYEVRKQDVKYLKRAWQIVVSDVKKYPKKGVHAKQFANYPTISIRGVPAKVIIKLVNILLTPEKPTYPGGEWRVEGRMNEAISATGIYYYDEENITESKLSFRRAVDEPEDWENKAQLMAEYALKIGGRLNQPLGSMTIKEGRCICFPNNDQHRVSSFSLIDKTKPGHRKILAFFLVNPTNDEVPDTSIIPPQQQDWYTPEELKEVGGQRKASKEEALNWRVRLTNERSGFTRENNERIFNRVYE